MRGSRCFEQNVIENKLWLESQSPSLLDKEIMLSFSPFQGDTVVYISEVWQWYSPVIATMRSRRIEPTWNSMAEKHLTLTTQ